MTASASASRWTPVLAAALAVLMLVAAVALVALALGARVLGVELDDDAYTATPVPLPGS
jgi:hypothetical protein